jgi:membrane protein implicated in regulation of membrane protease activity
VQAALGWALAAAGALVVELFTGTFALLMVGGAALGAALAALATGGGALPWVLFVGLALVGLGLVRPWAVRRMRLGETRTNVEALVGETAYFAAPFDPVTRVGRVRVGGVEWRAQLWEGAPAGLAPDERSVFWVQEVRGATLVVVPLSSPQTPGRERPLT